METYGDAAIAIDRDVAARFPIRLPLDDRAQQRALAGLLAERDERQGSARPARGQGRDRLRRLRPPPEGVAGARLGRRDPGGRGRPGALRDHGRRRAPARVLQDDARARARADEPAHRRGVGDQGPRRAQGPRPSTSRSCRSRRRRERSTARSTSSPSRTRASASAGPCSRPRRTASPWSRPARARGAGVLLPGRTGLLLDDASPGRSPRRCGISSTTPSCARRLGEAAAEHAHERFDPARNARAVERVYDSLLGLEPEAEAPEAAQLPARAVAAR